MLQQLINHSTDLKKLLDEGYQIEVNGGYLLVHQIPFVNTNCQIQYGTIVTILNLATPDKVGAPPDHTVYFKGDAPCDTEGNELTAIINNSNATQLTDLILVNHYLSSKPKTGNYPDYYEKIHTYAEIISSYAKAIDSSVSAKPGMLKAVYSGTTVFQYPDINSAKAEIEYLNRKFKNQKIAIIGVGGTGSYILDLVSKTPVMEIHIYDNDVFQINNAFRAPGAIPIDKFETGNELKKVRYFRDIYSRMHSGIFSHDEYVTMENIHTFNDYDFVFICVDSNKVRCLIVDQLLTFGVSFIDVGLGVDKVDDSLLGTVRVTLASKDMSTHLNNRIGSADNEENEYKTNIQIAELNSLNAAMAVIKWKKTIGYYQDLKEEYNTLYFTNTGKVINEDFKA